MTNFWWLCFNFFDSTIFVISSNFCMKYKTSFYLWRLTFIFIFQITKLLPTINYCPHKNSIVYNAYVDTFNFFITILNIYIFFDEMAEVKTWNNKKKSTSVLIELPTVSFDYKKTLQFAQTKKVACEIYELAIGNQSFSY